MKSRCIVFQVAVGNRVNTGCLVVTLAAVPATLMIKSTRKPNAGNHVLMNVRSATNAAKSVQKSVDRALR